MRWWGCWHETCFTVAKRFLPHWVGDVARVVAVKPPRQAAEKISDRGCVGKAVGAAGARAAFVERFLTGLQDGLGGTAQDSAMSGKRGAQVAAGWHETGDVRSGRVACHVPFFKPGDVGA